MKKLLCLVVLAILACSCSLALDAGQGIELAGNDTTNTVTIAGQDAGYYTKGVAAFNPGNFSVVDGAVSLLGNMTGGGGASAFTDLIDVPGDYSGYGGTAVRVNPSEDGLEFANPQIDIYTDGIDFIASGNLTVLGLNGIVTGGYVGGDPTLTISAPPFIAARMERQAAQNIAYSTYDPIDFDTEIYEFGDIDCDTANGHVDIETTGYYLVISDMLMQDAVGKYRCLYIYVNGEQIIPFNWVGVNTLYPTVELSAVVYLEDGDYVEARIWQDIANPRALYVGNPHGNSITLVKL